MRHPLNFSITFPDRPPAQTRDAGRTSPHSPAFSSCSGSSSRDALTAPSHAFGCSASSSTELSFAGLWMVLAQVWRIALREDGRVAGAGSPSARLGSLLSPASPPQQLSRRRQQAHTFLQLRYNLASYAAPLAPRPSPTSSSSLPHLGPAPLLSRAMPVQQPALASAAPIGNSQDPAGYLAGRAAAVAYAAEHGFPLECAVEIATAWGDQGALALSLSRARGGAQEEADRVALRRRQRARQVRPPLVLLPLLLGPPSSSSSRPP